MINVFVIYPNLFLEKDLDPGSGSQWDRVQVPSRMVILVIQPVVVRVHLVKVHFGDPTWIPKISASTS
jgi:hypothetical protein